MQPAWRVVVLSVIASFAVGATVLVLSLRGEMPLRTFLFDVVTPVGAANLLALFVLIILPASLPMTLVGAYIAAQAADRKETHPFRFWLARGCGAGAGLGAIGSAIWFAAINIGNITDEGMALFVCAMALTGALAGSLVGSVVGAYCWCLTRTAPPNNKMQQSRG